MCGFAGWIGNDRASANPAHRMSRLKRMARQLVRRGPDEESFYDDGVLALAFRRLAIIDPQGGRQPVYLPHPHDRGG